MIAGRTLPALLLLICALGGLGGLACGPDSGGSLEATPEAPVLLIGIDGLEWEVLRPLMEQGRTPHLRALAESGCYGKLGTIIPTHSPVVWTSIATGQPMERHGITSFVDRQGRVFTSSRREGRALWDIADRYGLTANVFGWWITWPVEPIRGVMVSGTNAAAQLRHNWKPALMEGVDDQVHPVSLTDRVMTIAVEAGSEAVVTERMRDKVFGDLSDISLDETEQLIIDQTIWSISSDETYYQIALDIMADHPADLTMVYFGGPDVAGHRFWRHQEPEAFAYSGSSPEVDAALAGVLDNYYVWVDEMVGELVAKAGDGTTVFVVSDHGMHAVATQKPNSRGTTGDHQDGAPGVLIAAGPGIREQGGFERFLKSGALPTHGMVYSIAPTLLGLLGIPGARDMEGRLYPNLFTPEVRERARGREMVLSHDDGFRPPSMVELPAAAEKESLARMAELGYLDGKAAPVSRPVNPEGFVPDPNATLAGENEDGG